MEKKPGNGVVHAWLSKAHLPEKEKRHCGVRTGQFRGEEGRKAYQKG